MHWIRQLFSRREIDADIAAEMREHLEELAGELEAAGLSRREAEREARKRFGNPTLLEERSREVWRWRALEQLGTDTRYALRQLRRAPGFALTSALTLALGIGATTIVFSLVNAVILRPLPFPDPDRLVSVQSRSTRGVPHPTDLSYPTFFDFRSANQVFDHLVSYRDMEMGLTGAGEPVNLRGQIVSWDYFAALQVQPAVGRGFRLEEEVRGTRVVMLSHDLWISRFGGDPAIAGKSIALERQPYTVVGVAQKSFRFPLEQRGSQIWTTLAVDAGSDTVTPVTEQRGARLLNSFGRLKPGIAIDSAQAAMDGIAANLARRYPDESKNVAGTYVRPQGVTSALEARNPLLILLGAVGVVLLITCANVANLLLARTTEREHELAIRASIGAGHGRIVRQLLVEGLTLALLGCGAGVLVAQACLRLAIAFAGGSIPRLEEAGIDGRVLAFSIGLAFLTSAIFSLAPALRVARIELVGALKDASRSHTGRDDRLRRGLVAAQVALGLVLVSGAGLLGDGFLRLLQRDVGFRTGGLTSFRVGLPESKQQQMLEELDRIPGVVDSAAAMPLPLVGHQMGISFNIEERPSNPSERPSSDMAIVTPGYFETLGVPLLEGRGFTERDDGQSPPVLVVNEAFARQFFPGQKAVGKRIEPGATARGVRLGMREIVGVVGNARQSPLGAAPDPIYYFALKQLPWCCGSFIVRSADGRTLQEQDIRRAVAVLDAGAPVSDVRTFDEALSKGISMPRFQTLLLGSFAVIALLLTAVGLYGVLAYAVVRRTREIGVRVALGASRGKVVAMVLREAAITSGAGGIIGLAGAMAGNRIVGTLVSVSGSSQPVLLAASCLVVAAAVAAAALLPARRAASIDPLRALRTE